MKLTTYNHQKKMSNLPAKIKPELLQKFEFGMYIIHDYKYSESDFLVLWASGLVKKTMKEDNKVSLKRNQKHEAQKEISKALVAATEILRHKELITEESFPMAGLIFDEAKKTWPAMKLEEVLVAINFGSYGKYDNDVVYISPANVIRWIKRYLTQRYTITDGYLKRKDKHALKEAENKVSEKINKYWERFPNMLDSELQYWRASGKLSESCDRICAGIEKLKYLSSDNGFLGNVIDGDLKKVWWLKEQELQQYRMGAYDVKRFEDKIEMIYHKTVFLGLKDKIAAVCKRKSLIYWFRTLENIDTEGLKKCIEIYLNQGI